MVFPFDNPTIRDWELLQDDQELNPQNRTYTRPLAGAEQIWEHNKFVHNGHDICLGGIRIQTSLPRMELLKRLREAWMRLRYNSPLVSAEIVRDLHVNNHPSWVFTTASYNDVLRWTDATLHTHIYKDDTLTEEAVDAWVVKMTKLTFPYKNSSVKSEFHGHLLTESFTGKCVFMIHTNHSITDGASFFDVLYTILEDVVFPERREAAKSLNWGEEWKNLPPNPVELVGGVTKGWETEGLAALRRIDDVLEGQKIPTYHLHPQRTTLTKVGVTNRVIRTIPAEKSKDIVAKCKSLGFTVTQAFDAAFVFAKRALKPHDVEWESLQTVLYPCLITLRPVLAAPWRKRSTAVCTLSMVPLEVPHSAILSSSSNQVNQMTAVMHSLKAQYTEWLSNPHTRLFSPAQAIMHTNRAPSTDSTMVITNLGVIEKRLGKEWIANDGKKVLEIDDLYVSLRRLASEMVIHVWTIGGCIKVQAQASDMWDLEYMDKVVDHIVDNVLEWGKAA